MIRIYVGRLTSSVREEDLEDAFNKYGKVNSVHIKNGFAFVEMEDYEDGLEAIKKLNGSKIGGERIIVEESHGNNSRKRRYAVSDYDRRGRRSPPVHSDYRIEIENLSTGVSWQDLKDYFGKAGRVCFADAHKPEYTGVVEFQHREDMKYAIRKYNGKDLNGRKLRLYEVKRRARSRSSSRSMSRRRKRYSRSSSQSCRSRSKSETENKRKSPVNSDVSVSKEETLNKDEQPPNDLFEPSTQPTSCSSDKSRPIE